MSADSGTLQGLITYIANKAENWTHPGTDPRGYPNGTITFRDFTREERDVLLNALREAAALRADRDALAEALRHLIKGKHHGYWYDA